MRLPSLVVSTDKRSLVTTDGQPFFYLGETAWELIHRGSREDTELICSDRAAKGFNVLQIVALAELDGLNSPNVYGHCPLKDNDPLQPVEAYWQHADWVVECANRHGLYAGLLPTWGDKWKKFKSKGIPIFNEQNARAYGEWIGARYRNADVIWIVGGDRKVETEEELRIIRAMAEGIRSGDTTGHLITFHPNGCRTSSVYVGAEPWLDFNMCQTGHSRERRSWEFYEHDFEFLPRRPFVNGEPPYEAHPNNFRLGDDGWLDQTDVRRELYWAICGCASGFTYGCHAIWQMWEPKHQPKNMPRDTWKNSLSLPGSSQVQYGKKLALSRPWDNREIAQWPILAPQSSGENMIRAARGSNGSYLFAYLPNGQCVKLHKQAVSGDTWRITWFNPRNGTSIAGGEVAGNQEQILRPPFDPEGRDWVLILDDTAMGFNLP